eukprot:CAMPEP_0118657522 /NCGR_PEP_ID=MMETSP0785-20121206/14065_1 /TAXON_ID=91992 /ORGANISM="Bolidomonas pacifica, Strain CCMP 1866" /LENGTH=1204 /DNA_ID=CAMNT_0006550449 /DNA_START=43 /DNA_END=3654 /DNA_ORIENTATION=-
MFTSGNQNEPLLNDALLSDSATPAQNFMTPATHMFEASQSGELNEVAGDEESGGIYSSSMPGKKKKKASSSDSTDAELTSLADEVDQWRRRQANNSTGKTPKACMCGTLTRIQCGLVTMIVMAVLGVSGVFVGGPKIAKSELDNSDVSFTQLSMSNPSMDDYSFDVAAEVLIGNVSPLDGTIGAMDVDLYYKDTKLGTLSMPAIDVKAGKNNYKSIDTQRFNVVETAYDVWDDFSAAMLNDKIVNWVLKGTASVSSTLMGVTMTFKDIPFYKEIPLTCFDGLNDVQMSVFDLTQSTDDDVIVDMSICIENPSDISIQDLGSLYFGVHYDGAYMGNVTSETSSMMITRDDASDPECTAIGPKAYNIINMNGKLSPADKNKADTLMSRYLAGLDTAVSAVALSPIADSIPLFNKGMHGLELATTLNGDKTALVTGLDFEQATITPLDDNSMSMDMTALVAMTNPLGDNSPMNVTTVDMSVTMGYEGSTIGQVLTGPINVPVPNQINGESHLRVPATANMITTDQGEAMTAFAKDLINLDMLNVTLNGATDTTAYCVALGYDMHIKGVPVVLPNADIKPHPLGPVTVNGMGGLKDIEILTYSIPGNVPNDGSEDGCVENCGIKLNIEARVNNPSPFGLVVGTLNNHIRDSTETILGEVTATGLTLKPGDNIIQMEGKMNPSGDDAMIAAANFMSIYMSNQAQETSVVGIDAGPSSISWLNDVVNGIEMVATFPGAGDDFLALTDIEIQLMDMELTEDGGVRAASKVKAVLNVPTPVSQDIILDVSYSGMEFELVDIENGENHVGHIKLDVEKVPVVYNATEGTIVAKFDKVDMDVLDSDGLSFMIRDLMTNSSKNIRMVGTASPKVMTNMGELQLTGIPFTGETTMYGFNNLIDPADDVTPLLQIDAIDVLSGTTDTLSMSVNCTIRNPSQVKTELGAMKMDLYTATDDTDPNSPYRIGYVNIESFIMEANEERNALTSFYNVPAVYERPTSDDGKAEEAGKNFLSAFVSGEDQKAVAKGPIDGSGTDLDLLKPAIRALSTSATVPGLPDLILTSSVMHNDYHVVTGKLKTTLYVTNAFSATMTVTGTACEIYPCKTLVDADKGFSGGMSCSEYYGADRSAGLYTEDFGDPETVVGKSGLYQMRDRFVALHNMVTHAGELLETLTRAGHTGDFINLAGTLDVEIGDFIQQVNFRQENVPICEGDRHC